MADVNINKFRASVVRDGSKPASPGFIVSEGQDPVNPPGTNNYVPYSGATANVELGEYGVEAGFITLDTTPTNTPTDQGTIFWDADDETVDIVLNGYTMKIGEDLFYPVKNQTGSTIAKGVAVRFNGTVGASGRLLIAPFIADGSVPSSRFMGVTAEEILNGEDGKVLYFGRVRGINTNAFNEGDILYASTTVAGGYQTAIPLPPNNIVEVAAVISKSATVGTIFVRPTLGSNINKDEGVKITSVADKNLLQYQSGTSLWENKSLAQVLGGTSAQFVKGDGSLDSTTYGTGTVTSVGLSSATSGVTIGSTPVTTSGTITLAIATASGSQNGLLSSTDWTTFNNKQNALTNPVTGTGASGQVAYFTGTSAISSESNLFWDATNDRLGIGGLTTSYKLQITNSSSLGITISTVGSDSANPHIQMLNGAIDTTIAATSSGLELTAYSAHALLLKSSNVERFRIFALGNVHIGPTPASDNGARLQVSGTGNFVNTINPLILRSTNATTMWTEYYYNTSTISGYIGSGTGLIGGANASDFIIRSEADLVFASSGGNRRLTIASTGAANFSNSLRIQGSTVPTSGSGTELAWDGTNGYLLAYNRTSSAYLPLFVQGSSLNFGTGDGTTRLTIASTGAATFSSSITAKTLTLADSAVIQVIESTTGTNFNGLEMKNSGGSFYFGQDNSAGNFYGSGTAYSGSLYVSGNNPLVMFTNGTQRMRITSSGNVLIGSPPAADNGARLQVSGTATFSGNVGLGTLTPFSVTNFTTLTINGTNASLIEMQAGGTSYARIQATSSEMSLLARGGTPMVFYTNPGSDTERMRITSGGDVLVGSQIIPGAGGATTGVSLGNSGFITAQRNAATLGFFGRGTNDGELFAFYRGTTQVGNISVTGSSTSYNTSSDYRLKEDLQQVNGLEKINAINVYNYKWKTSTNRMDGVLAHELAEILPYAVFGVKDGEQMQSVDYSKIVPLLIQSIKELKQEIDTLKN